MKEHLNRKDEIKGVTESEMELLVRHSISLMDLKVVKLYGPEWRVSNVKDNGKRKKLGQEMKSKVEFVMKETLENWTEREILIQSIGRPHKDNVEYNSDSIENNVT